MIIPMVTRSYVWRQISAAASATLAQFAFEQYARYIKSPSWPVIPLILQVRTVINFIATATQRMDVFPCSKDALLKRN